MLILYTSFEKKQGGGRPYVIETQVFFYFFVFFWRLTFFLFYQHYMSNVNFSIIPGICGFKLQHNERANRIIFKDLPAGETLANAWLSGLTYLHLKRVDIRKFIEQNIQSTWDEFDAGKPEHTSLYDREGEGEHVRGHEHFYLGFFYIGQCSYEQKLLLLAAIISMSLCTMASISTECRGRSAPVGAKSRRETAVLESTESGDNSAGMGKGSGTNAKRVRTGRVGKNRKGKLLQSDGTAATEGGIQPVHVDFETDNHMDGSEGKGENSNSTFVRTPEGTPSGKEVEDRSTVSPKLGPLKPEVSTKFLLGKWEDLQKIYPLLAHKVYADKEALSDNDALVLDVLSCLVEFKNVELANSWSLYGILPEDKERILQLVHLCRLALKQGKWRRVSKKGGAV